MLLCYKDLKLFTEQWLYRNVFYCLDACNIETSSCLPTGYIFNNTASNKNLKRPVVLEVFFDGPIFNHTTHTCIHSMFRARKWVSRSYGCHPKQHVYQLCARHRLSDNTSWTLQRSLMRSIQGYISKAHSSSPLTQSIQRNYLPSDLGNHAVLLSC